MVMTAQRTDRTLTMMVQHILGFYSSPLSRSEHPPPQGISPTELFVMTGCCACVLSKEAVEVVFLGAVSTQLWRQTKYHGTVCSF